MRKSCGPAGGKTKTCGLTGGRLLDKGGGGRQIKLKKKGGKRGAENRGSVARQSAGASVTIPLSRLRANGEYAIARTPSFT